MNPFGLRHTIAPLLGLFLSAGTLVCCALPAMLVALGMGAVLAGLVTQLPGLIWLSAHKTLVFSAAAAMIAGAGIMQWRARRLPCPADPVQARLCTRLRWFGWWIWGASVLCFLVGGFFAFIAPYILEK